MYGQAVIPFSVNGENFYTHTSWFSEKQYNGWASIPQENKNLACYYALSTVAVAGIVAFTSCSYSEKLPLWDRSLAAMEKYSLVLEEPTSAVTSDGGLFWRLKKALNIQDWFRETIVLLLLSGEASHRLSTCARKTTRHSWADARACTFNVT